MHAGVQEGALASALSERVDETEAVETGAEAEAGAPAQAPTSPSKEPTMLVVGYTGSAYFINNKNTDSTTERARKREGKGGIFFGNMTPRVWDIRADENA